MSSKPSPHFSGLLPPPKENLTSYFTLGEIIDHISVLENDFPHVNINLLKKHLWQIRNNNVHPETHLRGFLKVFHKTDVYKEAFEQLDEGMKRQINVFIADGTAPQIMAAGLEHEKFALPPSPPVKKHFQEMVEKVENLFKEEILAHGVANGINGHCVNGAADDNHERSMNEVVEKVENFVKTDKMTHLVHGVHEVVDGINGHALNGAVDDTHEHAMNGMVERIGDFVKPEKMSHLVHGVVNGINGHTANGVLDDSRGHGMNGVGKKTDHFVKMDKLTNGGVHWINHHPVNGVDDTNGHVTNGVVDPVKPLSQVAPKEEFPRVFEDKAETKMMEYYGDKEFQNWGQSVRNTPRWTFVPKTVLGLQNLVRWARLNKKRVRCSGYRHSWSSTFSQNDQILVSLLNLEAVTKIPDPMSIEPEYIDPENELKTITFAAPSGVVARSADKALVRVGVAVTNEQFRRWAVKNNEWTMPVDVILVEVTWGGVNGPICHGAGRAHGTVNDYVRAVEYVDANGEHRTVSDPEHLKAAAGHFGLLGVVTHITFELDKMRYAIMQPIKPDIGLAIPPMSREDIPIALRKSFTQAQYDNALLDFKNRAENHYYAEWFWFTRSQQAWVNTWNPTSDKTDLQDYPSPILTWFQWVEGWLGAVITGSPIFHAMPGRWQAEILATFGMVNLPPFEFSDYQQEKTETIKTALPNALHFRRGIQNMRVRDLEFQIPIPGMPHDPSKPDWSVVRRAWWDVINLCYGDDDDCPMRLTMELRIMGSSALHMAPQNGNTHGTASIEVLSIPDTVTHNEWIPFIQAVADKWMSYKDGDGKALNVRPHWAKEWENIEMGGKPARQYLKEVAYKDQIPKFRETLKDIGRVQGWGLEDLKSRFSNELWDYMVFD